MFTLDFAKGFMHVHIHLLSKFIWLYELVVPKNK